MQVCAHIVEELERAGKQQQLQGYEMIKAVHVTLEDWNEANDLMTPSLKVSHLRRMILPGSSAVSHHQIALFVQGHA